MAAIGVAVADNHVATISGISVENSSAFGIGIDVKGSLHLVDSDVGTGGLIGINIDASASNDGQFEMDGSRVLGATLYGVQVGGSPAANANLDLSEVAGATVAIIISNGALVVTNSKLSGAQRGLVLTSAGTASITGSDLSGVVDKAVTNAAGGVIDASGNWWGTTSGAAVLAKTDGPTGSVDFTPFLDSSTDGNGATAGFVGDLSYLHVTALGGQSGAVGRIQEGVDTVSAAGTVEVGDGIYDEAVLVNKTVDLTSTTLHGAQIQRTTGAAIADHRRCDRRDDRRVRNSGQSKQ